MTTSTLCHTERVGDIHNLLRDELWHHSRIQIHAGKTQIWNRGGFEPPNHAALLEVARVADPEAKLWFGDLEDRPEEGGIRVLGTRVQLQPFCCSTAFRFAARQHDALFGSVWLPFLAMTHPIQCGRWGVCPCTWGASGCEVWADCLHTISELHAHIAHTVTDAFSPPHRSCEESRQSG